ncbi:Small-conductance mechanosensitive channel [Ruminococcaceae bacterium YRB3002]|nr:Small-conductance mechanosensitive channel [Ruminococcaceae bacterium YRB3002]
MLGESKLPEFDWTGFIADNIVMLIYLVGVLVIIFLVWLLRKINHRVFKKIKKKHKEIHFHFLERLISAVIIIAGIVLVFAMFGGFDSIWKTLLGGTAIISAVLAFVAQDAIKDVLGGLMISIYRPFELGNRIVLEDGTAGIVKDITMRHVVLQGVDSQVLVIPNSKLNAMKLINYSYQVGYRSAQFNFNVAYGTDVELAMSVIKNAIMSSEYSIPGLMIDGERQYADVYFMAYEDSSLRLTTTVFYEPGNRTEVVTSDINVRVNQALAEHHIEIPFQYVNVITKQENA